MPVFLVTFAIEDFSIHASGWKLLVQTIHIASILDGWELRILIDWKVIVSKLGLLNAFFLIYNILEIIMPCIKTEPSVLGSVWVVFF